MDEGREYKHSCKYCKKKFICGRALGGHMRSHMTIAGDETDEILQKTNGLDGESDERCGVEAHHQGGYGLRENPKKSSRFSDSATLAGRDANVCKECGKGFPSSKALFGHMKCHSERCSQDEGSCIEVQNAFDGRSDSEDVPKRKSKRRVPHTALSSMAAFGGMNSSYGCQFNPEQEDAAIALVMLSWGISHFSDFERDCAEEVNVRNSSDKNFVPKNFGLQLNKEVGVQNNKKAIDLGNDDSLRKPFRCPKELVGTELGAWGGNERSGIAFRESKKARGDVNGRKKVCVSAILSNRESDYESEEDYGISDSEFGGNSSKLSGSDLCVSDIGKIARKRARLESHTSKEQKFKGEGYECTSCKKQFHSYQALGGHRASHKGVKSCHARIDESENNSLETNISWDQDNRTMAEDEPKYSTVEPEMPEDEANVEKKKGKQHECPVCFKMFKSGQALGGHKRSHMISNGGSLIGGDQTNAIVNRRQMAGIRDFLDLNLPAPDEHEPNDDHSGYSSS